MATLATDVSPEKRLPICIGCDVGQIHDPSAICVSEVSQIDTGRVRYSGEQTLGHHDARGFWVPPQGIYPVMRSEYTVRHITRLPLNTSYPEVAQHIADMLSKDIFQNRDVRLLIDVTGVGRPVYDDLKQEISLRKNNAEMEQLGLSWKNGNYRLHLKPISFTQGETYNKRTGSLGKAFLVSRLQSLLQSNRVHAPKTKEVLATLEELKVYEIKVNNKGKDEYGASTGAHDDLATALALSTLEDPYGEKATHSRKVF